MGIVVKIRIQYDNVNKFFMSEISPVLNTEDICLVGRGYFHYSKRTFKVVGPIFIVCGSNKFFLVLGILRHTLKPHIHTHHTLKPHIHRHT